MHAKEQRISFVRSFGRSAEKGSQRFIWIRESTIGLHHNYNDDRNIAVGIVVVAILIRFFLFLLLLYFPKSLSFCAVQCSCLYFIFPCIFGSYGVCIHDHLMNTNRQCFHSSGHFCTQQVDRSIHILCSSKKMYVCSTKAGKINTICCCCVQSNQIQRATVFVK